MYICNNLSLLVLISTVQHIGIGVCRAQSAGFQQVGRFDCGFGNGDATQTQHLDENKIQNGSGFSPNAYI